MAITRETCDNGCSHYDPGFTNGGSKPTAAVARVAHERSLLGREGWDSVERALCEGCLRSVLLASQTTRERLVGDGADKRSGPWKRVKEVKWLTERPGEVADGLPDWGMAELERVGAAP